MVHVGREGDVNSHQCLDGTAYKQVVCRTSGSKSSPSPKDNELVCYLAKLCSARKVFVYISFLTYAKA